MAYPHKWSPISYESSAGQRKHIGQRPMLYRWATQPNGFVIVTSLVQLYLERSVSGIFCSPVLFQNILLCSIVWRMNKFNMQNSLKLQTEMFRFSTCHQDSFKHHLNYHAQSDCTRESTAAIVAATASWREHTYYPKHCWCHKTLVTTIHRMHLTVNCVCTKSFCP